MHPRNKGGLEKSSQFDEISECISQVGKNKHGIKVLAGLYLLLIVNRARKRKDVLPSVSQQHEIKTRRENTRKISKVSLA